MTNDALPPIVNIPQSIDVLSRTLWGEARGCGSAGMRHVANVIVNRAMHPSWWGNGLIAVCLQPYQFSCRNPGDPNRDKLLAVTTKDQDFSIAVEIAQQAVAGKLPDATDGADSYYALSMRQPPPWAAKSTKTFADGWHAFYRTTDPAPPGGTRPDVRNVSVQAPVEDEADALMDAELTKLNPTPETHP